MPEPQKPSIGRIVIYDPGHDTKYGDGSRCPAIIQQVFESDNTVRLTVFAPTGMFIETHVPYGDGESCWSWPPRV